MQDSNRSFWFQCHSHLLTMIRDLGSLKLLIPLLILLHVSLGLLVPPLVTSDFERNLFYGKAFWNHGFSVYDMTPLEIDLSYNVRDPLTGDYSYPNITYDYPTLQLFFWAILARFPFSSIIAKWVLSCVDILNFFLLYLLVRGQKSEEEAHSDLDKGFSLSYLFFSIPFSAIEGQATAITVLFLLLTLLLHTKYPIWSYVSVGLGFHWKYVSLLVLPYLLIQDRKKIKLAVLGMLTVLVSILLLSFPLFFSDFILQYFRSFGNLGAYSGQLPSNPLLLFYPSISSLLSTGVLILALLYWIGLFTSDETTEKRRDYIISHSYWFPFVLLLGFLKIYATAFPWYWMWFYPPLAILPQNERLLFVVFLGITFAIGLVDFIQMTVGLIDFINFFF